MNETEIALLLKRARENEGITQKEAAERVNYSPQAISLWEQGKVTIKLDFLFHYLNALKCNPIDFLDAKILPSEGEILFDNDAFLSFLRKKMNEKGISEKHLEKVLDVSKPTLRRIFRGENVVGIMQFYALKDYFGFQTKEAFLLDNTEEPIENPKKHRYRPYIILSSMLLLLILIGGCVTFGIHSFNTKENVSKVSSFENGILPSTGNSTFKPEQSSDGISIPSNDGFPILSSDEETISSSDSSSFALTKEETPAITIDYLERKLLGFEKGFEYKIGNDRIVANEDSISIDLDWTDKVLHIIRLHRDESFSDSDPCSLYIKKANFNNYFPLPEGNVLYANEADKNLENRIDTYVKSFESSQQKDYQVSQEELSLLKKNLSMDIPYLDDSYFNKPLALTTGSHFSAVDYETITSEDDSKYVLGKGMKDKTKSAVYIEKEYDGISDIRIDDYAFESSKNPSLDTILFEKKPHKLGDGVFSGLYLTYLDFGIDDDRSYYMDMNVKKYDLGYDTIKRASCFDHFKGAQYARLPLPNEVTYSSKYPVTYFGYFGANKNNTDSPLDSDFKGFMALMFSSDSSDPAKLLSIKSNLFNNMKVRSLYIPKTTHFAPDFDRDLYLRLVRYEPGYSDTASLTLDNSTIETPRGKFLDCMALEYYLRDDNPLYNNIYSSSLFKGCISLRGVIDESVYQIGKEVFHSTRLPEKVHLRNIANIQSHAFDGTYGLKEVHIYNNPNVNAVYVRSNAFVNNSNDTNSSTKIEKIVFHNFNTEEEKAKLTLEANYKTVDIQEVFVSDQAK